MLVIRTNGATPNLGLGTLFEAFAAFVIGGVSIRGGTGRLSGVQLLRHFEVAKVVGS